MCKKCGCGLSDPKDPGFGKGPKKTAAKKTAAKKSGKK